mmetsp:Transcript_9627/g.26965  ORF Transcript_9627/g.26965 Transcript_9627/m.26965 type:complete len:201 (+) Transcript_9627:602-1204(+)
MHCCPFVLGAQALMPRSLFSLEQLSSCCLVFAAVLLNTPPLPLKLAPVVLEAMPPSLDLAAFVLHRNGLTLNPSIQGMALADKAGLLLLSFLLLVLEVTTNHVQFGALSLDLKLVCPEGVPPLLQRISLALVAAALPLQLLLLLVHVLKPLLQVELVLRELLALLLDLFLPMSKAEHAVCNVLLLPPQLLALLLQLAAQV